MKTGENILASITLHNELNARELILVEIITVPLPNIDRAVVMEMILVDTTWNVINSINHKHACYTFYT